MLTRFKFEKAGLCEDVFMPAIGPLLGWKRTACWGKEPPVTVYHSLLPRWLQEVCLPRLPPSL